jgi:hypothetical protein
MQCQACGRHAPTKYVEFYQNIGMLVVRSMRSIRGNLCKHCIKKYAFKMTGLTLLTGWWGMISFVINPFLILNNMFRYAMSLGMSDGGGQAPAGSMVTAQPGRPLAVGSPPPPPPRPAGAAPPPPAGLAAHRQDIVLRLRGGQTPAQVASYIAPLAGVPTGTVQKYAESLRG